MRFPITNSVLLWLLNLEDAQRVEDAQPGFGESWAARRPLAVGLCAAVAIGVAAWFYLRGQSRGSRRARIALASCRGLLLALLVTMLADPVLKLVNVKTPLPLLYVVYDGTDSMAIADELPEAQRKALDEATGRVSAGSADPARDRPTRMDYVKALLQKKDDNVVGELAKKFRLKHFVLSRRDGVDAIASVDNLGNPVTPAAVADKLSTEGQVTNLAAALDDLHGKHGTNRLAGVVMISDFDRNAGPAPTGGRGTAAAKLGVPVYAVGVGPESAMDVKIDLIAPPVIKKAEKRAISVVLEQQGFDGQTVSVRVVAQRIGGDDSNGTAEAIEIGTRSVTLDGHSVAAAPIEWIPQESGEFELAAEVAPLPQETIHNNNRVTRKVQILDDFLRLLFVEYEPTWEWRFIKEVFHRDRLVGMKGFRTYLHSASPKVKQSRELFVPSLTPRTRSEFFANDVIFLGDIPAEVLTKAFCERLDEFVGTFGGGLVVMAGPRFGAGQYAHVTSNPEMDRALKKLRDMLPVEIDAAAKIKEGRFTMELTPLGRQTEFMRLPGVAGGSDNGGWDSLGRLPWYQPVKRPHPQALVLAEHPTDTCGDEGKTRQPLIAIRNYGSKGGQVVYIGFNETWRMRRKYGEQYYRQFWGQLIHHLGFSHALGGDKRFVVRLDNDQGRYQAGDKVALTVQAYDEEYAELTEDKYRKLSARLVRQGGPAAAQASEEFNVPILRPGVFEARVPVFAEGSYRIQVRDPVTDKWKDVDFQVSSRSAERRSAVRNVALQEALAHDTGGRSYDLTTVSKLAEDLTLAPLVEKETEVRSLWATRLFFGLVVALMLGEWTARKMVNLQ